jgi:hypothetical protein
MSEWVAAGFGLAGVVVGGLLNGGVTALSERNRGKNAGRSAARLVLEEVNTIGAIANAAHVSGAYGPEVDTGFPREEWNEHRAILAAALPREDWYAVSNVYLWCRRLEIAHRIATTPLKTGDKHQYSDGDAYADLLKSADRSQRTLYRFLDGHEPAEAATAS